jgi:O-antigen/teichoic acid export membrane protein
MTEKRKLFGDMIVNIISFGIPIAILQFFVLPHLAARMDAESYGIVLTFTALVSIISEMAIGTLANVRVLENENYSKKDKIGVFKLLFYILVCGSGLLLFIVSVVLYKATLSDVFYLLIYYLFLSFRIYYLSEFRIKKLYFGVMVNNIIISAGYIVGIIIFDITNIWQHVYIVSVLLSLLHLFSRTSFNKESLIIDASIGSLAKQNTSLMVSYIIGNGMSYLDRLFLYPLLGGPSVSIYQVSTLMGKLYSLIGAPINMVVLSYTADFEGIKKKVIVKIIFFSALFGTLYSIFAILVSPLILNLLYPQYYESASNYIPIVTIAISIFNMSTVLRIISMKTIGYNSILVIELTYAFLYIILTLSLIKNSGLMGFCVAALISAISRFGLYILMNLTGKTFNMFSVLKGHNTL